MEAIICCLFGVFVGMAVAGYMCVKECARKERIIAEQKEENLQVCSENKELRAEIEDIKFDLSVANRAIEQKDEIAKRIKVVVNSFMTQEDKLNRIRELADDYQSIN